MSEELNEVHIKSYDEWLKYYENATKEQVIEDLTQDVKYFADAVKDIKDLQNKLQQKENIIKEVRDILRKHICNPSGLKNGWHIDCWNNEDMSKLNEDLGILDKGE